METIYEHQFSLFLSVLRGPPPGSRRLKGAPGIWVVRAQPGVPGQDGLPGAKGDRGYNGTDGLPGQRGNQSNEMRAILFFWYDQAISS